MSSDVLTPARIPAREFRWVQEFLLSRTGIELKPGKETLVVGRLDKRLRTLGLPGYEEYVRLLQSPAGAEEARVAVDLLTTNETYFFREPRHFELLPSLLPTGQTRPVRVWSAASSTGEEACSIALTLAGSLGERPWEVVGTDISGRVVETATRGLYPLEDAAKIPTPLLKAHCLKGHGDYEGFLTLEPALRSRICYRQANLVEPLPDLGLFDAVFLRNVMIYFGQDTKQDLVRRVAETIRPGGYLLIGHAESLTGLDTPLLPVAPAVYQVPRG